MSYECCIHQRAALRYTLTSDCIVHSTLAGSSSHQTKIEVRLGAVALTVVLCSGCTLTFRARRGLHRSVGVKVQKLSKTETCRETCIS